MIIFVMQDVDDLGNPGKMQLLIDISMVTIGLISQIKFLEGKKKVIFIN